ncbi:MAG TPA: hypothetical protein VJG83_03870 [archaeon]|nr:hypothetical protein [archaeon]
MKVIAIVTDIFFKAKIAEVANSLGVKVEFANSFESCRGAQKVIVDLEKFGTLGIEELKKSDAQIVVIGYFSHVKKELAELAKRSGCDIIVPKSEFSKKLPQLLA